MSAEQVSSELLRLELAGRVVVEFTEKEQPSTFADLSKFRDGTKLVSTTKQLAWDTADKGFFTVNTPGTKAVVGFAEGKPQHLGDVTLELQCPYASLFVTALDKGATLANAKSALVCIVARNCNSGFKYFAVDGRTIDNGNAPILLEPAKAAVTFANRAPESVNILDHTGHRTERTLAVNGGRFTLDGAKEQTLYYEVVFK